MNFFGAVLPLAVTLVTVPIYLRLIGDVRFGVLAIVWLFLSYFGLFDMGLGRATSRFMATLHNAQHAERESLFWTVLAVNVGFGLTGAAILWASGRFLLQHFFHVPQNMQSEVFGALPWIAVAVPVATGVSVLAGALEGREQFFLVNSLQIFGAAIFQLVPLVVAWWRGPNLQLLIASAVLARLGASIPMLVACVNHVPLKGEGKFQRHWLADLFSFSGWVSISGLLNPILTSLDRMLVGALQGAQALTYYTVSFNFAIKLTIIPTSLTRALFPRFSMLGENDAKELGKRATLSLATVMTPIVVIAIVLLRPFFNLWLGPRLAGLSAPVGEIFLIGFWVNSLALVPHCLLQARNRPNVVAKFHALELLPFVGILWLALRYGGIETAAWIWTLRSAIDTALLFWASGLPKRMLALIGIPTAIVLLTRIAVKHSLGHTGASATVGLLALGTCALWSWASAPAIVRGLWTQSLTLIQIFRVEGQPITPIRTVEELSAHER